MRIGIDILKIEDVEKKASDNPKFINQLLTEVETKDWNIKKFAGKIAAKEAIIKTGYIKAGEWHKVQIVNSDTGEPIVNDHFGSQLEKIQISISYSDKYCVSVALYDK